MMVRLVEIERPITIRQGILTFRMEGNYPITGQRLRAAVGRLCPQYPQLSQRTPSGELIYRHPHVQFKSMDGMGLVTALGEEAEILVEVFATLPELIIAGKRIRVVEKKIDVLHVLIGPTEECDEYVFISPWLALNQENVRLYIKHDQGGKRKLLEQVLTGNILSMAKGLGFFIVPRVTATLRGRWSEVRCIFKGIEMRGIRCGFRTTMHIPYLWGIGQKPSSGFGTTVSMQRGATCANYQIMS